MPDFAGLALNLSVVFTSYYDKQANFYAY